MSDRDPGSRVAVWIAWRRAHQGSVANLAGYWFDSGRLVPGYVAEALEELTHGGLLALDEENPPSGGVRRITVTDTGSAHYVALCQVHTLHRRPVVSTPRRWAHSPHDQRSHLRVTHNPDQIGVLIGVCRHEGRLHLLTPADVVAAARGNAQTLCGHCLPAEGLTITNAGGALCLTCVAGITATSADLRPKIGPAGSPASPLLAGGGVRG
jgi:hypothetical protein